jgi:CPA1 family monovalent cation:H+ antiporter
MAGRTAGARTLIGHDQTFAGQLPQRLESHESSMTGLSVETAIIVALLAVVTVALFVRRINLPYTIALVVMGLVLSVVPSFPTFDLTREVILLVFLPPLLFEASFNLDFDSIMENVTAILLLAVPGVVLGAFLIAAILNVSLDRSFESMLVFGALIAATDPISVLAIFGKLGSPRRLATIVEGESLFNDGVAIVLFGVVLTSATGGSTSLLHGLFEFVKVAIGGGLVGVVIAWLATMVLRRVDDHLIEITITTIVAFGSFVAGEQLHVSGVIAVVIAGLALGRLRDTVMSTTTRITLDAFWEYVAFLGNSMIFLLMGMRIAAPKLLDNLGALALVMLAVLVSRSVIVVLVNIALRPLYRQLPWRWTPVIAWGGLRGAVALALALSLPETLPAREWIQLMTFGVVLVTILVQGLTMQPLLQWLGLERAAKKI